MSEQNGKIVLLQIRDVAESAEREVQSVLKVSGLAPDRLRAVNVLLGGDPTTAFDGATALIIGGSGYSVFNDMPMLDELIELTIAARERGLPIFGICFGIQLIAHAFGGRVIRDHENRERGTFEVRLTEHAKYDALFAKLPSRFWAQCSHQDTIVSLPEDARLLASSERCQVQAFVMPGRIYGVQFHPERSKTDMEQIFQKKTHEMKNIVDILSPGGEPLRESPHAAAILRRFIETL